MTYEEAMDRETMVTRAEVVRELLRHGIEDTTEFDAEMGVREEYRAADVLAWLGY